MPDTGGPYVQAALFCDRVLTEQDGVLSLIRIIDRLIATRQGPDVPDEMPPIDVHTSLVLALKAGSATGRSTVKITAEDPSGLQMPIEMRLPIHLEGNDRGVNLVVQLAFTAEHEGVYWFNVHLEEGNQFLTRMPLRVLYQPVRAGS